MRRAVSERASAAPLSLALARHRGWAYAELPDGLVARLEAWLGSGPDAECETLKPARVWRWRDVVVKRFEPDGFERLGWRASGATRAARKHFAVLPIRTPRPLAVIESARGASLLASEHIAGPALHVAWREHPAAAAALPAFVAQMHAHDVFHGDLHPGNALWNGREWVLLDLDGLRHPLRIVLRRRRIVADQWSRLYFGLRGDPALRAAFDAYADARALGSGREAIWRAALAGAERRRARVFGASGWV